MSVRQVFISNRGLYRWNVHLSFNCLHCPPLYWITESRISRLLLSDIATLLLNNAQKTSVNWIIRLLISPFCLLEVNLLSDVHCILHSFLQNSTLTCGQLPVTKRYRRWRATSGWTPRRSLTRLRTLARFNAKFRTISTRRRPCCRPLKSRMPEHHTIPVLKTTK